MPALRSDDNREYQLSSDETTIGRGDECNVRIPSPTVSRIHAKILKEKNHYYVVDQGSSNGTRLNGSRVTRKQLLRHGDRLEFARVSFTFWCGNAGLDESTNDFGIVIEPPVVVQENIDDSGNSIQREIVRTGDCIALPARDAEPGFREQNILRRFAIASVPAAPVIGGDVTRKLMQTMQLVDGLRRRTRTREILETYTDHLYDCYPTAANVLFLRSLDSEASAQVMAASARDPEAPIPLCLPLVTHSLRTSEAILYSEHWKSGADADSRLSHLQAQSILVVPIIDGTHQPVGVIQVISGAQAPIFQPPDLELLTVLSRVVSAWLENALVLYPQESGFFEAGSVPQLQRDTDHGNENESEHGPVSD